MGFEVTQNLADFWVKQIESFPLLSKTALEIVVPFTTTHLCEMAFSTLLHIKSKFRNRLNAKPDLRIALGMKCHHLQK